MYSRLACLGVPLILRPLQRTALPRAALFATRLFTLTSGLLARPPRQGSGGSTRTSHLYQKIPDQVRLVGGLVGTAAFTAFVIFPFLSLMLVVLPPIFVGTFFGIRRRMRQRVATNETRWGMLDKSDMVYDRPVTAMGDLVADYEHVAKFTAQRLLRSLEVNEKQIVDKLHLKLDLNQAMPRLVLGELSAVDTVVRLNPALPMGGQYMYTLTAPLSLAERNQEQRVGTVVVCATNEYEVNPKMAIEVIPQTWLFTSTNTIQITNSLEDVDDGETIVVKPRG